MGQIFSTGPSPTRDPDVAACFDTFFSKFKKESTIISKEKIELIKTHLKNKNTREALSVISDELRDIEKVPLNIAVTGETGTGKSTFINALRGMGHEEEGSAATGAVETTTTRMPYRHPNLPNVTVWDLPGIGSTNFKPENYLRQMKFHEYDFFIIVSAIRFKENDVKLAKVIAKMGVSFYFVRTKVDNDIYNEQRSKPNSFNREEVLQKIQKETSKILREALKSEAPKSQAPIFLISSLDVAAYDFPKLHSTLLSELEVHKRHIFMLSMHNVTEEAINLKRDSLRQKVFLEALKSGAIATVPFGGLYIDDKTQETLDLYRSYFGLDDASLEAIAKDFKVSVTDLQAYIQSPRLLKEVKDKTFPEKVLDNIKIVSSFTGGPIATVIYLQKTYALQTYFLHTVASDAKDLLNKEELFGKIASFRSHTREQGGTNWPDFGH